MSRAIKFRAWDKAENRMYQNVGIDPHAASYFAFDQDGGIIDAYGSAPTLMQYTGLKDKTGKDIYEGDIVVTENEQEGEWPVEGQYKGVVTYNDQRAAFYIQQPHDTYTPTLSNLAIKSIEVLGNCYEHPELIEGKS